MMNCDMLKTRLGELLDGELPEELRPEIEQHLSVCPTCRAELESLQSMARTLSQSPTVELPATLWDAIERRLDEPRIEDDSPIKPISTRRPPLLYRFSRHPLAVAAVVVLAIGAGWAVLSAPWASTVMASEIDFRPLLEQADGDIAAGIDAIMQKYGGEVVTAEEAARRMKIRVHALDVLPGGMRLEARYLLNMGNDHRALAFHYTGPGGHLLVLQCPPMIQKDYGGRECMSCQVGSKCGHGIHAGKLYLMHMGSDNVCVCVVSTLDEHSELPAALDAIKIDF